MAQANLHSIVRHVCREVEWDTKCLNPIHTSLSTLRTSVVCSSSAVDGLIVKAYTHRDFVRGKQTESEDKKLILAPMYVVEASVGFLLNYLPHVVPLVDCFCLPAPHHHAAIGKVHATIHMMKAFTTLSDWSVTASPSDMCVVLLQLAATLHLLQVDHGFKHGDFHSKNVLLFKSESKVRWFRYVIDGMPYYVPDIGVCVTITDFQCSIARDKYGTYIQSSMLSLDILVKGADAIMDAKGADMQMLLFDLRRVLRIEKRKKLQRIIMKGLHALDTDFHKRSTSNVTPQSFAMRMFGGNTLSVCDFTQKPRQTRIETLINH